MVRYVFNCWRNHAEMMLVRRQFYHDQVSALRAGTAADDDEGDDGENDDNDDDDCGDDGDNNSGGGDGKEEQSLADSRRLRKQRQRRQRAVARVAMWMTRQHCPHMVESTALLTAALLSDDDAGNHNAWSTYAVRATYAAAFSRFVTGLLDGHQDKQRKQSMYAVAKKIGLPATFVELRHQSTHEQLPCRAKLRLMANKALAWIWDYFWKNLAVDAGPRSHPCRDAILKYLQGDDDDARKTVTLKELGRWDPGLVLATIVELQETLPGNQVFLKCLKLSKEVTMVRNRGAGLAVGRDTGPNLSQAAPAARVPLLAKSKPPSEPEPEPSAGLYQGAPAGPDTELDSGWSLYEGPWKAKPIGAV